MLHRTTTWLLGPKTQLRPLGQLSLQPPNSVLRRRLRRCNPLKKKRGRPRKYGPDGSVTMALSPKPISSSAPPPVIDFSAVHKRGKFRPVGTASKQQQHKVEVENNLGIDSSFHASFGIIILFSVLFFWHA